MQRSLSSINCILSWAPSWEKKGWKKPSGEIKNLDIIQDCYVIFRRIKDKLMLTHVAGDTGTRGNELATAWPCSVCRAKKRATFVPWQKGYPDAAQDADRVIAPKAGD